MQRLFTIFAALVVVTISVSVVAILSLRWTIDAKDQVLSRYAEIQLAIENLGQLSDRRARKLRTFLLTGSVRFLEERATSRGEFNGAVQALEPFLEHAQELRLLREVAELNRKTADVGDQLVDLKLRGASFEEIESVLVMHLQPVRDDADEAMDDLGQAVDTRSQAETRLANRRVANASTLLGAAIALAVIFSLLLGLMLHRTTRRILAEQDELDHAARYQQEVTAIVSHDLRSPLTAIMATAAVALRDCDSAAERGRIERILRGARRIDALATVLLDVTRLHVVRRIPLVLEDADFHALVADRIASVSDGHERVAIEHERVADGRAHFDGERLGQSVDVLLAQAMQHADPGSTMHVVTRGERSSVSLEITVQGQASVGTLLARMFDPFGRGPREKNRPVRLSRGFGLYLAHELVSAHTGTIDIRSEDAAKLVFRMHIPRVPTATSGPTMKAERTQRAIEPPGSGRGGMSSATST